MCNYSRLGFLVIGTVDAYLLALFVVTLKLHIAVDLCKQRIVAANADTVAGMKFGSALTYQNAARADVLTVSGLDAKPFSF